MVGQQVHVGRYDAFAGFSFFSTPKSNPFERGLNGEFGVNLTSWISVGGDFSVFNGHSSLTPSDLTPSQRARLTPFLAVLPPGTALSVPYDAATYTFSAGPQVNIRKLAALTFFVRPALGAFHQTVTARPDSQTTTIIVATLIGSSGRTSDTAVFYGFGGGLDINVSRHLAIRMASDFVHVNPFQGLLDGGYNLVRFSVGPTFRWGKNVADRH